jgi:hypothetical protein
MENNLESVDLFPVNIKTGEVKYSDLQSYKALINTNPRKEWIKTNPYSQNAKYIPIRIVEELLGGVFPFWEVIQVGEPKILGNSVVISVNLRVFNPLINQWLSFAGVGAVPIELESTKKDKVTGAIISEGARSPLDFERITSKGLHKNVPAALSYAINNAAKKIGKLFGSHLNSKSDETIK